MRQRSYPSHRGFLASIALTPGEDVLGPSWKVIGGVVTRPSGFGPVELLAGRLALEHTGDVIEWKLQQDGIDLTAVRELAASVGWTAVIELVVEPLAVGLHTYTLHARRKAGSSSGEIRYASLSLVEP